MKYFLFLVITLLSTLCPSVVIDVSLAGALGSVLADYVARHYSSPRAVGIGVVCQISGVATPVLSAGIYLAIDEGQASLQTPASAALVS